MSTRGFTSTFSLFFGGALLLIVLNPVTSSSTLCETRCENAVPNLKRLKNLWHNVSKRVGGDDPFPVFIQTILIATRRDRRLRKLRAELIEMLIEYKDCVKACEHQHSKRNGQYSSYSYHPVQPREIICFSPTFCV